MVLRVCLGSVSSVVVCSILLFFRFARCLVTMVVCICFEVSVYVFL